MKKEPDRLYYYISPEILPKKKIWAFAKEMKYGPLVRVTRRDLVELLKKRK